MRREGVAKEVINLQGNQCLPYLAATLKVTPARKKLLHRNICMCTSQMLDISHGAINATYLIF